MCVRLYLCVLGVIICVCVCVRVFVCSCVCVFVSVARRLATAPDDIVRRHSLMTNYGWVNNPNSPMWWVGESPEVVFVYGHSLIINHDNSFRHFALIFSMMTCPTMRFNDESFRWMTRGFPLKGENGNSCGGCRKQS